MKSETDALLDAIISMGSHLDLNTVLQNFVDITVDLTKARYGAINVLDLTGSSTTFVYAGVESRIAALMANAPHSRGVLSQIPPHGVLMLSDLRDHPAFEGFPANHPSMGSFLGTAVRVREQIFGYLYLAEKDGGFTSADVRVVASLASGAGVAIHNAQMYAEARRREHWLQAGQDITTMMLSGADQDEALETIARTARQVANADTCALILPGLDGDLVMEIVEGDLAGQMLGTIMPPGGRSHTVMLDGIGMVVDSLSTARNLHLDILRNFGPAMYTPLSHDGRGVGVMLLLRRNAREVFTEADLATAESFAGQATLALVLGEARLAQDREALLDERERIARDLHDLAIQQLFATGMQLDQVRRQTITGVERGELVTVVTSALDNLDLTVKEIRKIVHALRDPSSTATLGERLVREASVARSALGFAPSLVITIDGITYSGDVDELDARVSDDLADDVVAVVREGLSNAARHANASSVGVTVTVDGEAPEGALMVEVVDDGSGIPQTLSRRSGTLNLAARARGHRGHFKLVSGEDKGTRLVWSAPLV